VSASASSETAPSRDALGLPPPLADYHLHIQGREICEALARLKARNPAVFQGLDPSIMNPRSGDDALRLLDTAGIEQGVLLSEAYMFGSPLMAPDNADVAALTRAENAYNVAEARKSGGRLVAFVGVDPLSPTALPEIKHWSGAGAAGVKLHLANSMFDFGAASHMRQLKAVVEAARHHRMPIIVHLRNRMEWGAAQANAFIDQILPSAEGVAVTVAHGAGWGALDSPTVEALDAFAKAIAAGRAGTTRLTFDLAIVLAPWTKPDDPPLFVEAMRRVGLNRFQFASDWPAKYAPGEQLAFLFKTLPLAPAEWSVVLAHRAPYLPRDPRSA
jgi:predicted TIM-barrel fold metal-dependent hydrolase